MVTTEISQLTRECNAWRETLRSYRDEFGQLKSRLQEVAARQTRKDILLEVEHLHNQFHIQLINIHDLRHAIRNHARQLTTAFALPDQSADNTLAQHETLFDEFQSLQITLQELRQEFAGFLSRTR